MPRHPDGRPAAPRRHRAAAVLLIVVGLLVAWMAFRAVQLRGALEDAEAGLRAAVSGAGRGDDDDDDDDEGGRGGSPLEERVRLA